MVGVTGIEPVTPSMGVASGFYTVGHFCIQGVSRRPAPVYSGAYGYGTQHQSIRLCADPAR